MAGSEKLDTPAPHSVIHFEEVRSGLAQVLRDVLQQELDMRDTMRDAKMNQELVLRCPPSPVDSLGALMSDGASMKRSASPSGLMEMLRTELDALSVNLGAEWRQDLDERFEHLYNQLHGGCSAGTQSLPTAFFSKAVDKAASTLNRGISDAASSAFTQVVCSGGGRSKPPCASGGGGDQQSSRLDKAPPGSSAAIAAPPRKAKRSSTLPAEKYTALEEWKPPLSVSRPRESPEGARGVRGAAVGTQDVAHDASSRRASPDFAVGSVPLSMFRSQLNQDVARKASIEEVPANTLRSQLMFELEEEEAVPSKALDKGTASMSSMASITTAAPLDSASKCPSPPHEEHPDSANELPSIFLNNQNLGAKEVGVPCTIKDTDAEAAFLDNTSQSLARNGALSTTAEQVLVPLPPPPKGILGWLHKFQQRSQKARDAAHADLMVKRGSVGQVGSVLWAIRLRVLLVVESMMFDLCISSMIVLNAITIGVQSDYMVQNFDKEVPKTFTDLERIFCAVFSAELFLRLLVYGGKFFLMPEWRWNVFDTFIVGVQLTEELLLAVGLEASGGNNNFSFMRILRILRLIRIMRLVRLLRFVQELRTMVCSIASSMKSLMWTLVLIMLMMYVIGVYLTQLIADTGSENPDIMEEEVALKDYYGSLPRAVLSLYQAMTGGVDWNDLVLPLETKISPWLAGVFALYIAFAVMAMMNVVTGVFVESALLTAREDRESEVVNQVRTLFNITDKDGSGTISWEEFCETLEEPDMEKYFQSLDIDREEARGLFLLLDTDGSGSIDAEEFTQGCLRLRGAAKAIDLSTLMYSNKRMLCWFRDKFKSMEVSLFCIQEYLDDRSPEMMVSEGSVLSGHPGCTILEDMPALAAPLQSSDLPMNGEHLRVSFRPSDAGLRSSRLSVEDSRMKKARMESLRASWAAALEEEEEEATFYSTWAELKAAGCKRGQDFEVARTSQACAPQEVTHANS